MPARRLAGLPFLNLDDAREKLLGQIGLDEEGKRRLGERFVQVLTDALGAEETKFFAHEGEVIDERNVKAWGAILRALDLTADTLGLKAPRANGVVIRPTIHLTLPPGSLLPPIEGEIIESGHTSGTPDPQPPTEPST